jgi:RNA polymerase sigma factor (sigma-70 family)
MAGNELIPHLFRTEYRKIVSVLCARMGFGQMEVAEDIASETFLTAMQTWPMAGLPPHPVAWLYHVAKNKARNYLQREAVFRGKVLPAIKNVNKDESEIDLSPANIEDSQLRMMFTICHPSISAEAQIGLSLRILCGFGIEEIADAFLTNKETINKRLYRAREKLREEKVDIALLNAHMIAARLPAVLTTIYLLFTEGYYLRNDFCQEAMRLCRMLIDYPPTDQPMANALLALMCFHASRLDARVDQQGELVLYADQDVSRWNAQLISEGVFYLHRSASGPALTKYHLEANIAYWHCVKEDSTEKWENILQFYNYLLQLEYSPVAALNRTYALSKVQGKPVALAEALKLKLGGNPYYFALLGELYAGIDDTRARECYQKAASLAKSDADRQILLRKIETLRL